MNETVLEKRKFQMTMLFLGVIVLTYLSAWVTDYGFVSSLEAVPGAMAWMASNLLVDGEALGKLPDIMGKLIETVFMSIAATTIAAALSLFLAIMGSKTTMVNRAFGAVSRFVASLSRNIPVVAWSLILLLSFGQNSVTGFLALFVGTVGFLTRAFIETIDEAALGSVEALRATGATYWQIVSKAVVPQGLPQMVSWVLFMIETNIRSATLVGILTGTGIGYMFDMYYKTMNYEVVALITITIVLSVILIELLSTRIRKVIL